MKKFLAGVGKALLFRGNELFAVAQTLTESTFSFDITSEEIRAGAGNALWGKYFHDSSLSVTLTDAMFSLEYMAAALGTTVTQGGLSINEESDVAVKTAGTVELAEIPLAFEGTLIGWYKKPTEENWTVGTIVKGTGNKYNMNIPASKQNETYCIKYFWQNPNARSITIKTQYVPAELHVVIINDLFSGDVGASSDTPKIGRLITDIPRLQMDGSQELSLNSTSAATVSLTGMALAVTSTDTCEDEPYYGTMTEEIFGESWEDNVVALAVQNAELTMSSEAVDTLIVRAVFSGSSAAQIKSNDNFTFAVVTGTSVEVSNEVGKEGQITAKSTKGESIVSVTLKGNHPNLDPAYARITVE